MFCAYAFGTDWHLFQLIVFVKPDFDWRKIFALSCFDKVTAGTWSCASLQKFNAN